MGETNVPPSPVPLHISLTSLSFLKVHLMMEPFCVILKRALASEHPLHQILKYHCRDILTPNVVGTPVLLDEGKFVDQLFAFGNSGSAQILDNGYEFVTWEVTDFRGEIKVRIEFSRLTALASKSDPAASPSSFLLGCALSP